MRGNIQFSFQNLLFAGPIPNHLLNRFHFISLKNMVYINQTKYGVYKIPEVEIKSQGFGVKGSGFYGRTKGQIKSPYGTKVVESDPDREIKLYPLKRLFNQTQKEISSIDLKSCTNFRMDKKNIQSLKNVKYIFSDKDKLAKYNEENPLLEGLKIDKDIHILKETGHFPYFEDPAQLEEVLIKILSNN